MIPSVDQVAFSRAVLCNCFSCLLCASRSVTAECFSVRVRTRAVSAGKRVYRPADTPRTLQWFRSFGLSHRRLTDDWRRSFEKVDRFKTCEKMAEEQMRQLAERIAALEAELRATQQANAELTQGLTEQREIAETAQLRADRRGRAQMQDFAQMTAEMVAARGPEGQGERRFGVKLERPDYFEGGKQQDVDTWLFQVREHLNDDDDARARTSPLCRLSIPRQRCTVVARAV